MIMSSSYSPNQQEIVSDFKRRDIETFKTLVKSRITEIADVPYLEEFISDFNQSDHIRHNRRIKPIEWYKERKKKDALKKKIKEKDQGSDHTVGLIGSALTQEHVKKVNILIKFLIQPLRLKEEGLFRKSGNISRQKKLEEVFNFKDLETLQSTLDSEIISPHDVASLLKLILREMPEPLLTSGPNQVYEKLNDLQTKPASFLECLQLLIQLLPVENSELLCNLLKLLQKTVAEAGNRMTADTLGVLFAPHILSCRPMDAESLKLQAELGDTTLIMAFMIKKSHLLFQAPQSLINAIRNSINSEDPVPTKSEGQAIEEEGAALQCRYTYSQKEVRKDADFEAVELAKLYANIAAMKNSAQKKKLIKKIVKKTNLPAKHSPTERHKRSRSVSSTLKKLVSKNTVYKQASGHPSTSPQPGFRQLRHSQSHNNYSSPVVHHRSPHSEISSPSNTSWIPITKLFHEALDNSCKHLYDESPEKEISHNPSLVEVVHHHKWKDIRKHVKSNITPVPIQRSVTTIQFHSPEIEKSEHIISRRRDCINSKLPPQHPGRAVLKHRQGVVAATPTGAKMKSAIKRKVEVDVGHKNSPMVMTRSASCSSVRSATQSPVTKQTYQQAMTSPHAYGSPLGNTLVNATHHIRKNMGTPRTRTPVAMQ